METQLVGKRPEDPAGIPAYIAELARNLVATRGASAVAVAEATARSFEVSRDAAAAERWRDVAAAVAAMQSSTSA
jgi:hypothetical protein